MKYILITFILGIYTHCYSQNILSKEIDSLYNFTPHKLSKAEQSKIFPALDSLFEKIIKDTTTYLPLLRQELKSNKHNPYFYYDLSQLLMSLSKTKNDLEIIANALSNTDIRDLEPESFTKMLNKLALKNIDVSNAALKILDDTTYSFFVPAHSLKFSQEYCLIYSLLPIDNHLFINKLINKFKLSKSPNSQKSIVTIIWLANSCNGDVFLKSLNKSNCLNNSVIDYKDGLNNMKLSFQEINTAKDLTENELNEIQNNALKRYSDEALDELLFVTKAKRKYWSCR